MHSSIRVAGSPILGRVSPMAWTTQFAVPSSRDTVPSVTARPRTMAPIVMLRQPVRKPSRMTPSDMPRAAAKTIADSTQSRNASFTQLASKSRKGRIATPSSTPMGTAKSARLGW
jgi:hypothetical protein